MEDRRGSGIMVRGLKRVPCFEVVIVAVADRSRLVAPGHLAQANLKESTRGGPLGPRAASQVGLESGDYVQGVAET
jgi:hypothetical protein